MMKGEEIAGQSKNEEACWWCEAGVFSRVEPCVRSEVVMHGDAHPRCL